MNKYFKALFCVPLAGLKYIMLKAANGSHFKGKFPALTSPLTEITCERGSTLHIGKILKMHNGAKIRVRKGGTLTIGSHFGMSNGCVVTAYDSIAIGNHVMLGPNTLILRGTHIGDNCVVAGGAVIRGSYPANTVIIQKRKTEVIYQHGETS